jgi:hypothetical protein
MSGDIQKLCEKIVGKTIVSCEVDFNDQVIYLENGSIQAIGTFEEIREKIPNFEKQAKLMGL